MGIEMALQGFEEVSGPEMIFPEVPPVLEFSPFGIAETATEVTGFDNMPINDKFLYFTNCRGRFCHKGGSPGGLDIQPPNS
jgi:hypothetical protein